MLSKKRRDEKQKMGTERFGVDNAEKAQTWLKLFV